MTSTRTSFRKLVWSRLVLPLTIYKAGTHVTVLLLLGAKLGVSAAEWQCLLSDAGPAHDLEPRPPLRRHAVAIQLLTYFGHMICIHRCLSTRVPERSRYVGEPGFGITYHCYFSFNVSTTSDAPHGTRPVAATCLPRLQQILCQRSQSFCTCTCWIPCQPEDKVDTLLVFVLSCSSPGPRDMLVAATWLRDLS